MTHAAACKAKDLSKVTDQKAVAAILKAIESHDVAGSPGWAEIMSLSDDTSVEGLDGHPDGLFATADGRFEAAGMACILLSYGEGENRESIGESLPLFAEGRYDPASGLATISSLRIDASSIEG